VKRSAKPWSGEDFVVCDTEFEDVLAVVVDGREDAVVDVVDCREGEGA